MVLLIAMGLESFDALIAFINKRLKEEAQQRQEATGNDDRNDTKSRDPL